MAARVFAFAGIVSLAVLGVVARPLAQYQGTFGQGAFHPGDGISPPSLIRQVEPKYTHDALQAKIEGTVTVEIVVGTDGHVMRQRVTRSLDKVYGLDMEALKAVSQWTFEPDSGKCLGSPAPVLLTVELSFRVH